MFENVRLLPLLSIIFKRLQHERLYHFLRVKGNGNDIILPVGKVSGKYQRQRHSAKHGLCVVNV